MMRAAVLLAATAGLLLAAVCGASAAGLREGFEAALPLNAELRSLEAQRDVVAARRARGDALLPLAPSVAGGVRSDVIGQDRGYLQLETGATAPLWLPGEARALRGTADAQGAALAAQIARQRLLVAGGVRAAYWAWAIAAAEQEAQRARVVLARALEQDLARQVRGGQVPEADLLVATADLRQAEAALRERALAAREAAIAFRVLTGREPSQGAEERPSGEAVRPDPNDPRLEAARAAVDANRAAERLAATRDRANPDVGAQLRWQRDARGEALSPNLLVSGRLPLRHPPTYRESLADARAGTLTAEAELVTAERVLRGAVDRARAAREAAFDLLRLAEARFAALSRQRQFYEEAYRAGQLPLIEVVRVRAQLADADSNRRRVRAEAGRAASDINQVLGIEPR
jgi:cobalt-zinc-cadmium efflux system outer membrane protein